MADSSSNSTPSRRESASINRVTKDSASVGIDANQVSIGGDVIGRDDIHGDEVYGNKVVINMPWVPVVFVLAILVLAIYLIWGPGRSSQSTLLPAATATLTPAPIGMPAKTHSPTPEPTPYAAVKAFTVMNGGKNTVVTPNETINVTTGESVLIRAEVTTNVDRNNLLFTWRTCGTGEQIVVWGNGVFEMSYKAPDVAGQDCVRVKVEKGGALLDDNVIFVNVLP